MAMARRWPCSHSPKEMGLCWHPRATGWLCGEDGSAPAASHRGVPRGRGRDQGVQPNAFQKISDEWPGRVIHIKPIKPLLAS